MNHFIICSIIFKTMNFPMNSPIDSIQRIDFTVDSNSARVLVLHLDSLLREIFPSDRSKFRCVKNDRTGRGRMKRTFQHDKVTIQEGSQRLTGVAKRGPRTDAINHVARLTGQTDQSFVSPCEKQRSRYAHGQTDGQTACSSVIKLTPR